MKASEVKIGKRYRAKVSGITCVVRIVSAHSARPTQGQFVSWWHAMNLRTNRLICIESARRLQPVREADLLGT